MSNPKRQTNKKSHVPAHKRNVNPKLNAFQREQRRARMANQPPVELNVRARGDVPSRSREQAAYIQEQRARRLERRSKIFGGNDESKASAVAKVNHDNTAAPAAAARTATPSENNRIKDPKMRNAQSLNTMIAADVDENSMAGRVRMSVLEKKATLRLKKKLRRRSKREEITERTLRDLMGRDAEDERLSNLGKGGRGKKAAAAAAAAASERARQQQLEDNAESMGALTRKEKKRLQAQKARQSAAERNRKKQDDSDLEEEILGDDNDAGGGGGGGVGHAVSTQRPASANGNGVDEDAVNNNNNDDDDDNSQQHQRRGKGKKGSGAPVVEGSEEWARQEQKRHRTAQGKGKEDHQEQQFDFVKYGDRVDAPPVFDVLPSAALGAALDRRTSKTRGGGAAIDADAAGGRRVRDLSTHSSLSEAAQKILRSTGGTSVMHIAVARQKEQEEQKQRSASGKKDDHFERTVTGASLSSAEDFAAYREQVLSNYAKNHKMSFGKERTYRPL